MNIVQRPEQVIVGPTVRTNNRNEMDPNRGKIGPLWQQLFSQEPVSPNDEQPKYGVYFDYQSDMNGDFTVLAGVESGNSDDNLGVTLAAGRYMVFSASGDMPQPVIDAWGEAWRYFAAEDCPHLRCYQTDFELYISPTQVELYIGIA